MQDYKIDMRLVVVFTYLHCDCIRITNLQFIIFIKHFRRNRYVKTRIF